VSQCKIDFSGLNYHNLNNDRSINLNRIDKILEPVFWFSSSIQLLRMMLKSSTIISMDKLSEILNIRKLKSDLFLQKQNFPVYHPEPIDGQELQLIIDLLFKTAQILEKNLNIKFSKNDKNKLIEYKQNISGDVSEEMNTIITDLFRLNM
jgi:hypothetical protein